MKNNIIIAISGKKQSGKSSLCEFLKDELTHKKDERKCGCIHLCHCCKTNVEIFNFADTLKDICINVLGFQEKYINGTDAEKNELTNYSLEKLPESIKNKFLTPNRAFLNMTYREVMQILGTDIFRRMFDELIWVKATLRDIEKFDAKISLIGDCRFLSETEFVLNKKNGYIIRLSRNINSKDTHPSETELDQYDFSSNKKCLFIDNQNMTIEEKNQIAIDWIKEKVIN